MRMFQARTDFKICEEDGSNSKNVSLQLNINESGLDTDNIMEFLGAFSECSQQLILDECSRYSRRCNMDDTLENSLDNTLNDSEAEEGWDML